MQHLGLQCPPPTHMNEDNTAIIALAKANKITNMLRHVDVPLCCMHNEHILQTLNIGYCPSKIIIANFLTKPLVSPCLPRETSFAMGYVFLTTMNEDHYKHLTSRRLTSTS